MIKLINAKENGLRSALGAALLLQLLLYLLQSLILSGVTLMTSRIEPDVSDVTVKVISLLTSAAVFLLPVKLYLRMTGASLRELSHTSPISEGNGAVSEGMTEKGAFRGKRSDGIPFVFAAAILLNAANLAGMLTDAAFSLFKPEYDTGAYSGSFVMLLLTFISSVVLAPVLEELMFRGAVLHSMRGHGVVATSFFSGLLFALMHYELYRFFYAFAAGVLIAYFAQRSGSLLYAVGLHAVNNLLTFISMAVGAYASEKVAAIFDLCLLAVSLPLAAVGAVILWKKRRNADAESAEKPKRANGSGDFWSTGGAIAVYIIVAAALTVMNTLL